MILLNSQKVNLDRIAEMEQALWLKWGDLTGRFNLLRGLYSLVEGKPYYPMYFQVPMTPIEENLWSDIREFGKARLYPQYPVGQYFVDFGDPWEKIAIEADGKHWHEMRKDQQRDRNLERLGWEIYHIPGKKTYVIGCLDEILESVYRREVLA